MRSPSFWMVATVLSGSMFWIGHAATGSPGKVYSKRNHLEIHTTADASAPAVGTVQWNDELDVIEHSGRWYKVKSGGVAGWIYTGYLSNEKLPKENQNEIPGHTSNVESGAAARPLDELAESYGNRQNLGDTVANLKWAETLSHSITSEQAKDYLKKQGIGEYKEAK